MLSNFYRYICNYLLKSGKSENFFCPGSFFKTSKNNIPDQ